MPNIPSDITPSQIFISGSLAYDRIMDFQGHFSDHIMADKIHMLNVSFTAANMVERLGGTAGNIAYCLSLLGEKSTIMASIGYDCPRYFDWLEQHGISTQGIRVIEDEFTSCAHITTDLSDNQITGFNPGAMKYTSDYDLSQVNPGKAIGIIAAGNKDDMRAYRNTYTERGIDFIFDPSQSLPLWETEDLTTCLTGARVLISNDYELELIMNRTSLNKAQLMERVNAIVTTKGPAGSLITTPTEEVTVPAVEIDGDPVDPTGAGDAFRGGLIKGMIGGENLVTSAKLGTVCASYAIQFLGTQEYSFTPEEFEARLRQTFG